MAIMTNRIDWIASVTFLHGGINQPNVIFLHTGLGIIKKKKQRVNV